MKRFGLFGTILGALLASVVVTASAFAAVSLPDISVTLTGGSYPLRIEGSVSATSATSFGSSSGIEFEGKGVTLLLLTTELSSLGMFNMTFTHVKDPNNSETCQTTGDAAGVVLMPGEFHMVPISLSPLELGLLFLVKEFTLTCGSEEIVTRGDLLASVAGIGSEGTELTGFSDTINGKEGKQSISEYYNDAGTKIKAKLESESGAGFVAGNLNIEGVLGLSVLGSKMMAITGR